MIAIALPITILAMTFSYSDEITCHFNVTTEMSSLEKNIGIKTWLYVIGSIDLIYNITIIYALFTMPNDNNLCCVIAGIVFLLGPLYILFRFAWLIVGSVLLIRDCQNLEPLPINRIMNVTLIIGFLLEILIFHTGCKKNKKNDALEKEHELPSANSLP
jgi:hypothetical protein